jgi:hypothetical protein
MTSSQRLLWWSLLLIALHQGTAFSTTQSPGLISMAAVFSRRRYSHSSSLESSKMSEEDDLRDSRRSASSTQLQTSSEEDSLPPFHDKKTHQNESDVSTVPSILQKMIDEIPFIHLFTGPGRKKLPPVQVDDVNVMLYDVFLLVNLSLSISFWVTHRLDFSFLPSAFNEGCLFSILWIASGLYHGSFLYSAMDGHFPMDDENGRGGPKDAAALAFNTYINAINLRLVAALLGAWLQHRKVGLDSMEELIPLEIGCGLVLMTFWRALHSSFTPRV